MHNLQQHQQHQQQHSLLIPPKPHDYHEERQRKEQHQRHQLLQHQHTQYHDRNRVQDWVKPPHHKGAWHCYHEPYRLLQYFLEYADKVNGVVYNTLNIEVAAPESEQFQLKISPMCASGLREDLSLIFVHYVVCVAFYVTVNTVHKVSISKLYTANILVLYFNELIV